MPESSKAVFLSYASQDAAAAQRLCEALRANGVEVWFDQNELVGGDAWDQKIRGQIKACALFVPVISAESQARREGYFRLEWKLAAQRTQTIADGTPFLLPVVVDATRDADALVPEEFRSVQWTRLTGGEATPGFVARVKKLLGAEVARAFPPVDSTDDTGTKARATTNHADQRPALPRRRSPFALPAAGFAIVVAIGTALLVSKKSDRPAAVRTSVETKAASATPVVNDKSIAVLPFDNMSDEKDSAFFADGIHEDILTNLSNIRELRVVSRTSVMGYRGTTKKIPEIARELGVTYILEGSVRRAGDTVRVTGQLIRAANDEHMWADKYDRKLADIFAIQSELAQAIAGALKTAISPQEKSLLEQRPTQNITAYELVLKARQWTNRPYATRGDLEEHRRLLQRAIELDPNYASAYADLAFSYVFLSRAASWASPGDTAKAKEAIDVAVRLAPGSPDVVRALGDYYYYGHRDYTLALEQYRKLGELRPNDPAYYNRVASIQRRQSHWLESLATFRKLEELEPNNLRNRRDIGILVAAGRRYDEAIEQQRRVVALVPDDLVSQFELADLCYVANGSTREMEQLLARLTPAQLNSPTGISVRKVWALRRGELAEAVRLERLEGSNPGLTLDMAVALAAQGKVEDARARLGNFTTDLRAKLEEDPRESAWWSDLGVAELLLGHQEEALRCVRKAVEMEPESRDALLGPRTHLALAFVLGWTGDKEAALAEYVHLFGVPFGFSLTAGSYPAASVHTMRLDPRFAPLRGDPRFEALLNDPKNATPLF